MTGHIVGLDPMTDRIVVLRKGADGKASRQVDVLTEAEAAKLGVLLRDAILVRNGELPRIVMAEVAAAPEPEQAAFDLDSLTEGDRA